MMLCLSSLSQADSPGDRIQSTLVSYYKKYPVEKVYVQTDKSVYLSSQTIWCKIYTTAYGGPSGISRVAYLQLIDKKGNIVVAKKLFLIDGSARGDIYIPDSLPGNTYQLRCFTAWMLNFEESGLFHKNLMIRNFADTSAAFSKRTARSEHFRLHFFPEGGDLVEGLASTVAFKATDEYGFPAEVTGEVRDETGTLISRITTVHDGMGKFELRPDALHHYMADIRFPDSSRQEIPLPEPKSSGVVMQVAERTPDEITLRIKYREQAKGQYRHLTLAGFQNTGESVVYPVDMNPGTNLFDIQCKDFSPGILRLTLFDARQIPLTERIVFIENKGRIAVQLARDTVSFKAKSRSSFSVKLSDEYWKLDKTSLSVSVTDADQVPDDTLSADIMSSLLMSSELKGYVYNSGYYFRHSDQETRNALDLVMLTNGWRHFAWKQVLNDEPYALSYPVEKSLFVAGQILDYGKYAPNAKPTLKLVIHNQDNSGFIGQAEPDSSGRFILKDYNISGLSEIYFHGTTQKNMDKTLRVKFITPTLDTVSTAPIINPPVLAFGDTYTTAWGIKEAAQIQSLHNAKLLKPAVVRGHAPGSTEMVIRKYVSSGFETDYYHDADLINTPYPNSMSLFDFLQGRFAGLTVLGTEDDPEFYVNTPEPPLPGNNQPKQPDKKSPKTDDKRKTPYPYFFLNEIMTNFQNVKDLPLNEIALIRYIPPPAYMAPMNGGWIGVIAIYTKKLDDERVGSKATDATHNRYIFHGYSVTREFPEPDYSRNDSLASGLDVRTTLYWNPYLAPDSSGQIQFDFYNSDLAKRYRVVIEGMDSRGRLMYLDSLIEKD